MSLVEGIIEKFPLLLRTIVLCVDAMWIPGKVMIARIPRENLSSHDVADSSQRLSAQLLTTVYVFKVQLWKESTSDK